jgi:hypothetical protein
MLQRLPKLSACNLNARFGTPLYKVAITQVFGAVLNVICSIHVFLKEGIAFIGSCA